MFSGYHNIVLFLSNNYIVMFFHNNYYNIVLLLQSNYYNTVLFFYSNYCNIVLSFLNNYCNIILSSLSSSLHVAGPFRIVTLFTACIKDCQLVTSPPASFTLMPNVSSMSCVFLCIFRLLPLFSKTNYYNIVLFCLSTLILSFQNWQYAETVA